MLPPAQQERHGPGAGREADRVPAGGQVRGKGDQQRMDQEQRPRGDPRGARVLPTGPGLHRPRDGAPHPEGSDDEEDQPLQSEPARVPGGVDALGGPKRTREGEGECSDRPVVHGSNAPRRAALLEVERALSVLEDRRVRAEKSGTQERAVGRPSEEEAGGDDQKSLQERLHGGKG